MRRLQWRKQQQPIEDAKSKVVVVVVVIEISIFLVSLLFVSLLSLSSTTSASTTTSNGRRSCFVVEPFSCSRNSASSFSSLLDDTRRTSRNQNEKDTNTRRQRRIPFQKNISTTRQSWGFQFSQNSSNNNERSFSTITCNSEHLGQTQLHAVQRPVKNDDINVDYERKQDTKPEKSQTSNKPIKTNVRIKLQKARPIPKTIWQTFVELWNDPRPVTASLSSRIDTTTTTTETIPYCIVSDPFKVRLPSSSSTKHDDEETTQDEDATTTKATKAPERTATFQVLLYPRGRFVSSGSSVGGEEESSNQSTSRRREGPAAAYLRYLPETYGDEVDVAWKLRLIKVRCTDSTSKGTQDNDEESLTIRTSGGLPKSIDTWSAAMTFCHPIEAIESVGRTTDWGSSIWNSKTVCETLQSKEFALEADIEMTVFDTRTDEISFDLSLNRGGLGATRRAIEQGSTSARNFRAGEVIVPLRTQNVRNGEVDDESRQALRLLEESHIYPGIDYRIMTMRDQYNNEIFSSTNHPTTTPEEMSKVKLALRPCGWKFQQQLLWKKSGGTRFMDWPVEVEANLLTNNPHTKCVSRFNRQAAIPRLTSAFARDPFVMTGATLLALLPIPLVLLLRNIISLYVIPSASMEPTILRGDVLLVEKFPYIQNRLHRGDIILFNPPTTLIDLINNNSKNGQSSTTTRVTTNGGNSAIGANSMFVKRLVGLPGDEHIDLDASSKEVYVNGQRAVGPDRTLCNDNNEPLRLIDKLLLDGKGTHIDMLNVDEVYVMGDCQSVSVDSRVFGPLPINKVVGKPIARIWPLNRFVLGGNIIP